MLWCDHCGHAFAEPDLPDGSDLLHDGRARRGRLVATDAPEGTRADPWPIACPACDTVHRIVYLDQTRRSA